MAKEPAWGFPLTPFGAGPESYLEGFNTATRAMEPWFRAWARGHLEMMTLASRRARVYLELPERLGRCRSPQDLANESVCYWQGLIEDYTQSSQRLAAGWSTIMQQMRGPEEPERRERDFITFPEPGEASDEERQRSSSRRAA